MKDELKDKILEVITSNSKKLQITLKEGNLIQINAITFLQILKLIVGKNSRDIEKHRVIKKVILNLISDDAIIELNGEPPFYFLKEEFDKIIVSKDNIRGIEGFTK